MDLDLRPYGSHADYAGNANAIVFWYSLSMMPPFEAVVARARQDLAPGGRVAAVDFLDAWGPVGFGLRRSHVHLGDARLSALRRAFVRHELEVRSPGLWRYYLFVGA